MIEHYSMAVFQHRISKSDGSRIIDSRDNFCGSEP
jgi:hypothetical protein